MSNPFDALGGMGGLGGLGSLMNNFQQKMKETQAEAEASTHEGQAGGGAVKVTVSGKMQVIEVQIDQSLMDDAEMLQDLILVATNNGLNAAKQNMQEKMSALTAGLPIPPGMLGF